MSNTPGYVSNSELAQRLSTLVDRWDRRENQMIALVTQEEGTVTVTDGLNRNHELPSFPQLQKNVRGMTDDLTGAVAEVRDMSSAVTTLAAGASRSAGEAEAAAERAERAAQQIGTAADTAEAQAALAVAKAAEASHSATTAGAHAATASASAAAASSTASAAASARVAAESARDSANLYANAPAGTEIAPGEYSAKHWAVQAKSAATGTLVYMGAWNPSTGSYPDSPVKGHFYKVVGNGTVGDTTYNAGDQIVYDGAAWDKIDNTDQVSSVAGKVGAVSLVAGDIGGLGALATRNDVDWTAHVTGKPATFPPSAHAHTKAEVGLGNVDNTSDLDKPISTATQTALDGKAAASHTHTIANVSGLQGALDAKANATNAQFTNPIHIGGSTDVSVQLNPTGGRSIRFAATATPNTGFWDATNSVWLLRINSDNSANFAAGVAATSLTSTGNVVAYASDVRLKTNIVDASADKVSDFFDRFRVREFDWDYDAIAELNPAFKPSADHEIGGIAQEAEEVYPLMVNEHEHTRIKTIQWEKVVPLLIAEVQSLRKRVAVLEGVA